MKGLNEWLVGGAALQLARLDGLRLVGLHRRRERASHVGDQARRHRRRTRSRRTAGASRWWGRWRTAGRTAAHLFGPLHIYSAGADGAAAKTCTAHLASNYRLGVISVLGTSSTSRTNSSSSPWCLLTEALYMKYPGALMRRTL